MSRANKYIQLVKVIYYKLPTKDKQLPAFPLEVTPRFYLQFQRWKASVLLHHSGPVGLVLQRVFDLTWTEAK